MESWNIPTLSAEREATIPRPRRPSLADVQQRVRILDPAAEPSSSRFRAAIVLLAAVELGQNVDRLSRFTRLERPFVAKCARRLVDNGVWQGGNTVAAWTWDLQAGRREFWNDVGVAEGKLCRRINNTGEMEWAAAGEWTKHYEYVEPQERADLSVRYYPRESHNPPPVAPIAAAEEEEESPAAASAAVEEPKRPRKLRRRRARTTPTLVLTRRVTEHTRRSQRMRLPSPPAVEENMAVPGADLFPDAVWLG